MGYRVVGRMKLQTVIGMLEANKQTNKAEGGGRGPHDNAFGRIREREREGGAAASVWY